MSATAFAIGNVASAVAIVLVNKRVFAGGFHFPMTLSFFHFIFAVVWYEALALAGTYAKPQPGAMPKFEQIKVAAVILASIGFMNLSLNANSVGFYQITKLTVIPLTLAINSLYYGVQTTTKLKLSLALLLAGVGVATVSEVQLKPIGLAYGVLAVISTSVCQIWQGSKQKEFGVSATQLQALTSPWMSVQALAVAIATEMTCGRDTSKPVTVASCADTPLTFFQAAMAGDGAKLDTLWTVLGTCALALLVNFTVFGLIGKTSAVTFQVVGHAKTCLVLVGGYLFFPSHGSGDHRHQQLVHNIMGVSVAMVGVILYGHLKHASGQGRPDCFDYVCPVCVLDVIISDEEKIDEERAELAGSPGESRIAASSDPLMREVERTSQA